MGVGPYKKVGDPDGADTRCEVTLIDHFPYSARPRVGMGCSKAEAEPLRNTFRKLDTLPANSFTLPTHSPRGEGHAAGQPWGKSVK